MTFVMLLTNPLSFLQLINLFQYSEPRTPRVTAREHIGASSYVSSVPFQGVLATCASALQMLGLYRSCDLGAYQDEMLHGTVVFQSLPTWEYSSDTNRVLVVLLLPSFD